MLRAEGGPDEIRLGDGGGGGGEAAFGVGSAADGEEDGFGIGLLTGCYILRQLRAVECLRAGEYGAVVACVGKVHGRLAPGAVEGCQEGQGDYVDVGICAVVG